MGGAKHPAAKIRAGSAPPQMQEERKEHFLDDLLSVLERQAKAEQVTQQTVSQLFEKAGNLLFESRRLRRTGGAHGFRQRKAEGRFWGLIRHLSSSRSAGGLAGVRAPFQSVALRSI